MHISEVVEPGFCGFTSQLLEYVGGFDGESREIGLDGSNRHLDGRIRMILMCIVDYESTCGSLAVDSN